MHNFSPTCATKCPEIERFHDAAHNVAGFNDYGRGKRHGFPSLDLSQATIKVCTKLLKGAQRAPFFILGFWAKLAIWLKVLPILYLPV
jgi:hypothetical protein